MNDRPVWARGWFWWLLALLSTAPFVVAPLPMMPDYFSHIARYHVMNHGAESPWLPRYYAFHWALIGNLGVDLLMLPLGRVLPTETAALVAAALIPPLTVAGIYAVGRAVWGRIEAPALLALPFVYTFSLLFGFVNYHLAVALALLALALWIAAAPWSMARRWAVFLPLGFGIWVAHVIGWAILLLLAGSWELVAARRGERGLGGKGVVAAFAAAAWRCLPLAFPLLLILLWRSGASAADTTGWWDFDLRFKFAWLFTMLRSENRMLDLVSLLLVMLAGLLMLRNRRVQRSPGLLLGAGTLGIAFLLMPKFVFGSFYGDERLLPVIAMIIFLGLAVPAGRARTPVALLGLALFGVRLTATTWGWHQRGTAAVADLHALDAVPRGSRIAVFAVSSDCETWVLHGLDHLASLAIVRRDAFVNTEWDIKGQQLMRPIYNAGRDYNEAYSTRLTGKADICDGQPLATVLATLPRDRFDFVWVFDQQADAGWLQPVFRGPHGTLYRIER